MHTLADMEDLLACNRRSVQFWTDAGALIPTADTRHMGRGVHRLFDSAEVVVGLIVRAAAQIQLPIGRLVSIATVVRREWLQDPEHKAILNSGIAGTAQVFMVIESGNRLVLLKNPPVDEAVEATFQEMVHANSIDDSWKGLIHLTPWLRRAKSTLT